MQWAKPRTASQTQAKHRHKINVEFELAPEPSETGTSPAATRRENSTSNASQYDRFSDTASSFSGRFQESRGEGDGGLGSAFASRSVDGSAWDYYSGSYTQDPGTYNDSHSSDRNVASGPEAQHNRSSYDVDSSPDSSGIGSGTSADESGWSNYLLPLLVVAVIIAVAFATML